MRILVAFLIGIVVFLAIPTGPMGLAQAQTTSSLEGFVCTADGYDRTAPDGYDGYEGCPDRLPGAIVHLHQDGVAGSAVGAVDAEATTDDAGHYRLDGLDPGTYTVTVERTGFASFEGSITIDGATSRSFSLEPEQVSAHGTVVGDDGKGIQGASVVLYGASGDFQAETDSDGAYAVQVPAGYYSFRVDAPRHQPGSRYVLVDGGAVDFHLAAAPPQDAILKGRVTDGDGAPVQGATVQVYQYGGYAYAEDDVMTSSSEPASGDRTDAGYAYPYYDGQNQTTTDGDGRFAFHVYSGGAQLSVWKDGYTQYNRWVETASGQTTTQDVTIKKIPDKTAHLVGKVTDAGSGKGLRYVSINVQNPEFGQYECSMDASDSGSGGGSSGSSGIAEPTPAPDAAVDRPYYEPGCALTMHADGSFEGDVTPGYTIVSVYFQQWRTCTDTQDADGSFHRACGPEYYSFIRTLELPADATTRIDVALKQRPVPDAVVSGYVLDQESKEPIVGARVSFSHMDGQGYGWAETDKDGSYRIRVHSGMQSVNVWADGYLNWQGTLDVPKQDKDTPFDVMLKEGQSGGPCCIYYEGRLDDAAAMDSAPQGEAAPTTGGAGADGVALGVDGSGDGNADVTYQDLKGGLGPYDADARQQAMQDAGASNGSPSVAWVLLAVGLLGMAAWRRR